MKRAVFITLLMFIGVLNSIIAQPFLQLLPKTFYKEDAQFTGADWAGYYRTSQYDEIGNSLMLLMPAGDSIMGICYSENGLYKRILKGSMKGNGITYTYQTYDLAPKNKKLNNPSGEGLMVMKDDGKKEEVYSKHGHASGLSEQKGSFSIGKKKGIELNDNYKASDFDWSGNWLIPLLYIYETDKYENVPFKLSNVGDHYEGTFEVTNFQKTFSETRKSGSGFGYNLMKTTKKTKTYPMSTVTIHGIPSGNCLHLMLYHPDGDWVGIGTLTMSADKNAISGPYLELYGKWDVQDLGKNKKYIIEAKRQ
jgi:hypothetical protein